MPFQKLIVVDCRGHMLGRLASVITKELLSGQKVVCVRTEEINISGSLFRNNVLFHRFLKKRTNSNPKKGPIHFRSPSRILWRVIRGMLRHKTARGTAAMEKLKVFEGVPHPYDKMKRQVIPCALRNLRLRPGRKYCRLGDLASKVGWKHDELINRLEDKRKTKSAAYYTTKKELNKLRAQAVKDTADELADTNKQLAALGY